MWDAFYLRETTGASLLSYERQATTTDHSSVATLTRFIRVLFSIDNIKTHGGHTLSTTATWGEGGLVNCSQSK